MSKPSRNKNWIRVGENIMAIKKANGMTNEQFSSFLQNRVSANKLSKATSGVVQFSDSELFWISIYTGISEESIKEDDTETFVKNNNLYKNSRKYQQGKTIEQIVSSNEIGTEFLFGVKYLETSFPLLTDEKSLKAHSFKTAVTLLNKTEFLEKETLDEVIQYFKDSISEGATDVAYANILSSLGIYYVIQSMGMDKYELLDSLQKKPSSQLDIPKILRESIKKDTVRKQQKAFFDNYGDLLDLCFDKLFKSRKYRDFADFFWFIKYSYQMISPEEFKLTDEEYCKICEHFLLYLVIKGNKYADNLLKIFDKNL